MASGQNTIFFVIRRGVYHARCLFTPLQAPNPVHSELKRNESGAQSHQTIWNSRSSGPKTNQFHDRGEGVLITPPCYIDHFYTC